MPEVYFFSEKTEIVVKKGCGLRVAGCGKIIIGLTLKDLFTIFHFSLFPPHSSSFTIFKVSL
ncbi:hypothetical protein GFO_2789 [Christiangramia forsetii KT0803]|uniref:Uncharacterized protein n=1 Tax=Christiangramia forsetii (strain DSM 17595 / CGMCC 1.15422 / KT0803) TaxID=411154 RepID=A0M548_CHRFK|nr:hypothetical protein GFO_2789 [Christiangramia forsetii KT0803]